jgi:predicted XRE-type DNA-binding protein
MAHMRLTKDLEHKMMASHDLSQLSMGMPMLFNKLQTSMSGKMTDTIDTHPNMSDLESIRNGLPMMPTMQMGLCSPMSLLKPSMPHLGMDQLMAAHPVSSWTQNDVLQWLDKIMLGNLRPVFQKHEISGDMLLDLAEEDLKNEMGINSGIVRRKLSRQLELLKEMHDSSHKMDSDLGDQSLEDVECDLAQCVIELNQVMHEEGLSQPKVARALGIQSQGHLSELLRGKYKHSRNSSAQHWAKEIRSFLSLTQKERQDAINIYGQSQCPKKRKSSKRTVWSKEQNMMLENFFRQKPSPTKPERQLLASQCCVEVGVINTYFQNKRRRSRHLQPL